MKSLSINIFISKAIIFLSTALILNACSESEESDTTTPNISVISPAPCDTIYFGEDLNFVAEFSDNIALKSYKLNIHHNFDHHTHGNHKEVCRMDDIKMAQNPFLQNWHSSLKEVPSIKLDTTFAIDDNNEPGDYHVLLYLTDVNGNQGWTGISIKIMERK